MNVLAIGSHPDDIELGCGGTLLRHVLRGDHVTMLVMTSGQRATSRHSSRVTEQQESARVIGATLRWGGFDDGSIPSDTTTIHVIDEAVSASGATVMYTHAPKDTHQDHRAVAVASLAAARRMQAVLYYETPSSQDFDPTVFVEIDGVLDRKLEALNAHRSQILRRGPVEVEAVQAVARFRGFQARAVHAEAFETPRFVWDLHSSVSERARRLETLRVEV